MDWHPHFRTGEPCNCGWGNNDHQLRVWATVKHSDTWEEIKGRKRYRNPQAQLILQGVQKARLHDVNDKWTPWLLEQIKKGHIQPQWAHICDNCGPNDKDTLGRLWGQITCQECRGDGETECPECWGRGNEECSECGGSGVLHPDCAECDGSGEIDCSPCQGQGEVQDDDDPDDVVDCPDCSGSGKEECPDCHGSGEEEEQCYECNGHGCVDCDNCSGTGEAECSECWGAGEEDCPECDNGHVRVTTSGFGDYNNTYAGALQASEDLADRMGYMPDDGELEPVTVEGFQIPGRSPSLSRGKWRHWTDWLDSGHGTRRAFNPTTQDLPDLVAGVKAWDDDLVARQRQENRDAGTVIHSTPDGWTVRTLNPEEVEAEGDVMGHCVGSYSDDVAEGKLRVLSLRDPKGNPHCTTGVRFDQAAMQKEDRDINDHGGGEIYQHYGKGNETPKPKYNKMLKDYFQSLPLEQRPRAEDYSSSVRNIGDVRRYLRGGSTDELGLSKQPESVYWSSIIASTIKPDRNGVLRKATPQMINDMYAFHQNTHHFPNLDPSSNVDSMDPSERFNQILEEQQDAWSEYAPDNEDVQERYRKAWQSRVDALRQLHESAQGTTVTASLSPRFTHKNYHTGEPCDCPFGRPAPKPDWSFTAAKIDWLRKREDMQTPEAQALLDGLAHYYPEADKLYPSIVKHWKQTRKLRQKLNDHFDQAVEKGIPVDQEKADQLVNRLEQMEAVHIDDNGAIRSTLSGLPRRVQRGQLTEMLSNAEKLKDHGRGVNFDSFTLPELFDHMEKEGKWLDARERENLGQLVHQFDNGWSIKRLQNAHECIKEGKDMHHCTGNPTQPEESMDHYKGMSYQEGVHPDASQSRYHLYSLRDPNNFPHATLETHNPIGHGDNRVVQFYGPHDQPGDDEHYEMVNEWLRPHGLHADWGGGQEMCTHCGEDEAEIDGMCEYCYDHHRPCSECGREENYADGLCQECYEKENFEPWWEDEYQADSPYTPEDYVSQYRDEDMESYAPPEFERAWSDAYDHDMEGPHLVPGDPDFQSIWENIAKPYTPYHRRIGPLVDPDQQRGEGWDRREFDPSDHQEFFDTVIQSRHLPDLYDAYQAWLHTEYEGAPEYPYEDDVHQFYNNAFAPHIHPGTGQLEEPRRVEKVEEDEVGPRYRYEWETAADRYWQQQAENYPQLGGSEPWQEVNQQYQDHYDENDNWMTEPRKYTVPLRPSYWSKVAGRKTHRHWQHGHPCGCPWGEHDARLAARIDHLKGRPDLQAEDAQSFLQNLEEQGYPDKLLNWFVREWKKGRIRLAHGHLYDSDLSNPRRITPALARNWERVLDESKRIGQGIDLMQYDAQQLRELMDKQDDELAQRDWPNLGEVVHRFDDGWTMRKLRNSREAKIEGDKEQMNHCVGGYGEGIDEGRNHIYSLRDPDNNPHVTVQLTAPHDTDEDNSLQQAYARNDNPIINEEHAEKVGEWLEDAPNGPNLINGRDKLEPWTKTFDDEEDRGQWWEDEYEDPIDSPEAYLYHYYDSGDPDYWEVLPEEYRAAVYDAEERGLQEPELVPGQIHWEEILSNLVNRTDHWEFERYWKPQHQMMSEALRDNPHHFQEFYNTWSRWKNGEQVRTGPHRFSPMAPAYDESSPYHRLVNDYWQQEFGKAYDPQRGDFGPPREPRSWWERNYKDYPQIPGFDWPTDGVLPTIPSYMRMGSAPLYYRWTFSPDTGEVEIGHNDEAHPAQVRYHEQIADEMNRAHVVNGYAYRIADGWRLSDDEHRPVEDPYVVSQVLRALNTKPTPAGPSWTPENEDFDRLHYGLPSQASD